MPELDEDGCRSRVLDARRAVLATVSPAGEPELVPVTFVVLGDRLFTAVDHKPKSTTRLRRLDNIASTPRVSLLVDHYDDRWDQLWWVRVTGTATVGPQVDPTTLEALAQKYEQYRSRPPGGALIAVEISRWQGWKAT
jgi:PPOX class probable F420-dependent enzyme